MRDRAFPLQPSLDIHGDRLITLGIESTAHTLGIGVCEDGCIRSNEMDTYRPKNEGIVPRKAADHHADLFNDVLGRALAEAGIGMDDVGLIAFAQGPGIGAPLHTGVVAAKFLASYHKKKIIGVNHAYAHMKVSERLTGLKKPLVLYVSGGNTQILLEKRFGDVHIIGETLDIGAGNLFDSFGRMLGMEYAHGSALSELASRGKYAELPYSVKGMNLVFGGLLTSARRKIGKAKNEDLAYSLMETSFSMLCEVTERALFLTKKKGLIVCGGVAQNTRLQEMLRTMCKEDGVRFGVAPNEFNRDNGGMIAYTGELISRKFGTRPVREWEAVQRYRIEQVRGMGL
ncbi:MAG: tRNA (adenosine(37)-N6)-threonylcarbamoyltransferase complex transferase subunit TsaD [Candidatus Bilamarchaeaceae archaeon]